MSRKLDGDCVYVGGVVDWYYLARPLRDIDLCSFHGHVAEQAHTMGGQFFGRKWRFTFHGWQVEAFSDFEPQFTHEFGVMMQTPARRLQVIRKILDLPTPSAWATRKRHRLAKLVPRYQELLAQRPQD